MYLQTALQKIERKHGDKTLTYVELIEDTPLVYGGNKDRRLDELLNEIVENFYVGFCLVDRTVPIELKTYRLSEPMTSPSGLCTMYRIYQERADGFHQIALVTVLENKQYPNYRWRERNIEANTKKPQGRPWWLWKDLN